MGDPSTESKAALTDGANAKRRFKEFLNRRRESKVSGGFSILKVMGNYIT